MDNLGERRESELRDWIPKPIQNGCNLGASAQSKFDNLKNDPAFLYQCLKLCDICHEGVKILQKYIAEK